MKWYSAISSYSSPDYLEMLEVAIITCKLNTKFKPNLICNTQWDPVEKLKDKYGINVIYHTGKVFSSFVKQFKNDKRLLGIAGTYLRADIPVIEEEDEYILYTDVDVMFGNPNLGKIPILAPNYFAAAPEFDINDWTYFNAGSILMNTKNMKADYERFSNFVIPNFDMLFKCAHDQGAYNHLYKGKWNKLPPEYNWKPNWGINEKAIVIHFHGPKPADIRNYFNNSLNNVKVDVPVDGTTLYKSMIEKNKDSCSYYLNKYNEYKAANT